LTYRSLWIEAHESQESAEALYFVGRAPKPLISLNAFTFPKSLHSFASEQGLPMSYVDNAWLRVAMAGRELRQFLTFGCRTEVDPDHQVDLIEDDTWFVVSEEEF
jgi:hypothetical protein